jgi:threonylcarbamoyladenosine tRNA methylthiotransferase MtaB
MAEVLTFGCRLNAYESEIIKTKAEKAGLEGENIFILNTCSVTKEAEKEAIKKIRKLKRDNPDAKIVVTGCAVQIRPEVFANMEEVSLIFGNKEKLTDTPYEVIKNGGVFEAKKEVVEHTRLEDKIFFNERKGFDLPSEKVLVNDIMSVKETHFAEVVSEFENQTRAFVQIQNGCNHRCTFCIIPFARGNSRSVPFGLLAREVQALVENGYKEVVLTGVDITDYGKDIEGGLTLGKMAKRLLKLVPDLSRLRFSSIDVAEVDDDIYDLIANEPRFMPYFHISLQSGDNLILKRMKRRHSREDVLEFVSRARSLRSGIAFGADIIAGFPTETEEHFENSRRLIEEAGISFCHIFSFSPHEGTPAFKMPQVERSVIKRRTNELILEGKKELKKLLEKMVGSELSVLIETGNLGRCENFAMGILPEGHKFNRGDIVKLKAVSVEDEKLIFAI